MTKVLLVGALLLLATGCAARALWLNGHPPVLEEYTDSIVRIYRAGVECRIEIINKKTTIITLPTRCLDVPHLEKP